MSAYITVFDYVVLSTIMLVSILIGLYHGYRDKIRTWLDRNRVDQEQQAAPSDEIELETDPKTPNRGKTSDFLMANSSLGTWPIALSLLASFYSATTIVGMPAEVYQYGILYWWTAVAHSMCPLVAAFVTAPFFVSHNVSSIFEYFDLRFESKYVRLVAVVCYLIRNSLSCAVFTYGPVTSLSLLANLDENICIAMLGLIGTFYTTIGGIRGVIWNDLFQALVMFTSMAALIPKGIYDAGGFTQLWEVNWAGGRLNFVNFDPDPFVRQSTWSILIGQFIYMTMVYCFDQQMIQRFRASRTKRIARRALIINSPGVFILVGVCCFTGLIIYANVAGCDPLTHPDPEKRIENPNQLLGYLVANNYNTFPGIAGLFLASIFCGSLSSVSSFLNSQAAIFWHDILSKFEPFRSFSDTKSLMTNKIIVIVCGAIGTGLTFSIATIGENLPQITSSLLGAFNAPLMGLFLLGMMFSVSTPRGAIAGTVAGFAMALWLGFGAFVVKPVYPKLNVSIELCPNSTDFLPNYKSGVLASELTGINKIYALSYVYYMPLGTLVTIIVGLIVSLVDTFISKKKPIVKKELIYFDLCGIFCCKKKK